MKVLSITIHLILNIFFAIYVSAYHFQYLGGVFLNEHNEFHSYFQILSLVLLIISCSYFLIYNNFVAKKKIFNIETFLAFMWLSYLMQIILVYIFGYASWPIYIVFLTIVCILFYFLSIKCKGAFAILTIIGLLGTTQTFCYERTGSKRHGYWSVENPEICLNINNFYGIIIATMALFYCHYIYSLYRNYFAAKTA